MSVLRFSPPVWYYCNPTTSVERKFDVHPQEMPGFVGWNLGTPLVEIDDEVQFGRTRPLSEGGSPSLREVMRRWIAG